MTSPTLDALSTSVYRDLADEAKAVFSLALVQDFIKGGIADLNRVAPLETTEIIPLVSDPTSGLITQFSYNILTIHPYGVELYRGSDGYTEPIDQAVEGQTVWTGWVFRETTTGGTIEFPQWYLSQIDNGVYDIRVRGYTPRVIPTLPTSVVQLDDEDEYAVRAYARAMGYDLLSHDRSMFAQWQGQTNNTDVSPTQLMQMAATAKSEWRSNRGLIRTVRRYW